jgi:hypothetical protein
MKRHVISTVIILTILVVAWTTLGQEEEGRAEQKRQSQRMSQEERQKVMARMRERFENMSEEEREKLRAEMRERFSIFRNPVEQQKSIKAIEEQLVKFKAAQIPRPEGGIQDLSEEERNKLREKRRTAFQQRQNALEAIIAQVARLQGLRQLEGEGARYLIVSTDELKQIQEVATKEKAKETSELLARMAEGLL